ncbi:MAG: hypothetical protein KGI51_09230 [Rhodospirillales bacterium]|nr:hypothetical protein [Rhodospirillales bacterium]
MRAAPAEGAIAGLTRLLIVALRALADAGRAEAACRIAARGWSLLRASAPREAERLTAALHVLARRAGPIAHPEGENDHV